jgi:non-specific serine/threonine protein kinase
MLALSGWWAIVSSNPSSARRAAFVAFATGTGDSIERPNNLPVPPTVLLGRDQELASTRRLIRRDDPRLLTLVGPPGVGKTRLAIQIAREALRDFADGAWFVALAPLNDPAVVLSAIANTLGVREEPAEPLLDTLQQQLRRKALLMVLDNFEHVLPAAQQVADLLAATPSVKVLATSREPLQLTGEYRHILSPLSLDGASGGARSGWPPAIELFIQRARAARPDLVVDDAAVACIADICHQLDGLPLAIELAAARVPVLSLVEMRSRLSDRLSLLTSGPQDLPERQRTLRAMIDWSYNLLNADGRAMFRRLGVFAGGATLHAIQTVMEIDGDLTAPVIDVLAELVAKNLIQRDEVGGESRYGMFATLREYALARLVEHGECERWQRRHAEYFVTLSLVAKDPLPNEPDNWRAALAFSEGAPDAGQIGLLLASYVGVYGLSGDWSEAQTRLERALAHPGAGARAPPRQGPGAIHLARPRRRSGRPEAGAGADRRDVRYRVRVG